MGPPFFGVFLVFCPFAWGREGVRSARSENAFLLASFLVYFLFSFRGKDNTWNARALGFGLGCVLLSSCSRRQSPQNTLV